MRACIYNPYLDTLGGGERYSLSFAEVLAKAGYKVDIQWPDTSIKEVLEKRFGRKIDEKTIFVKDINRGDGYELCFWISDGSIPILRARRNILHFQIPFVDVDGKSLLNRMKLFRINKIVCNSNFTKSYIDKEYGVKSIVIYPPVDTNKITPKRKENIILYVGRFSGLVQSKGQDVLIKAFKRLVEKKGLEGWRLILAGGVEVGVGDYLKKLKRLSKGYPIEFVESPGFKDLAGLYGKSRLFWSASGFGIDEKKDPQKVEHFGITTIEAMAAGCVPIVYSAGGQKEIVKNGVNGLLWKATNDLKLKTKDLIKNPKLLHSLAREAKNSVQKYSYEEFERQVLEII